MCLQPADGDGSNGTPILNLPCDGRAEQQWTKVYIKYAQSPICSPYCPTVMGDVSYFVNSKTGKCLDVRGASTADGAVIQQWECNGGASEQWWTRRDQGPFAQYLNYRTKKCIDLPFSVYDVNQWACYGSNGYQYFSLL